MGETIFAFHSQQACSHVAGGLFRFSYREFVFSRLSYVSLEHRPAQLRARQSGTRLQFIGQMVGFFPGRSAEMRI